MTDYRDPDRPGYRDRDIPTADQSWSNATWGWIAGIAVVVLVLIFAFGSGREQVASDTNAPPATTGQRTVPQPPTGGPTTEAPTMNRPAPAPRPTEPATPDAR